MKKILSIILPSIIILSIMFWSRVDKNILVGLYLLFPVVFIIQGVKYSDFKKELLIGFTLSSIAFILPINIWFRMGRCIEFLVFYNVLGTVSFLLRRKYLIDIDMP